MPLVQRVRITPVDGTAPHPAAECTVTFEVEQDGRVVPVPEDPGAIAWCRRHAGPMSVVAVLGAGFAGARRVGDGWVEGFLDRLTGEAPPVPVPPTFTGTLRGYQLRGLAWLSARHDLGVGACLSDDMGLGKTVQILALLAHAPMPTLLVCPVSAIPQWVREARRFVPTLQVQVHGASLPRRATGLLITSYQKLARHTAALAAMGWSRVVLDEAQQIRNAASGAARAAIALGAPHRVAVTGTPVENDLGDLWSLFAFLEPALFGAEEVFSSRYARAVEQEQDPVAAAALQRIIAPFVLRRLKTDPAIVADLPRCFEHIVDCPLTAEQVALYGAVLARLAMSSAGPGAVLAAIARLKQICDHPALVTPDDPTLAGRSGKLIRLESLLAGIVASGERALVFTQYRSMAEWLAPYLAARLGCRVLLLHGGIGRSARGALVEAFGRPDGPPVFVLSLKAGGTALNLTAANHVIHFDRWWNPAVEDQATDRAWRLGQTRDVHVHKLVCVGTVDGRIAELMAAKRTLAGTVVERRVHWSAGLSTAELVALAALEVGGQR